MTSLFLDCWLGFQYQLDFPLIEWAFSSIRELLVTDTVRVPLFPVSRAILCHIGGFCDSKASHLDRNIVCFSPMEVCMVPSSTMNTWFQEGGIKVSSSSVTFGHFV